MKRSIFTLVFIIALVSFVPASIAFGKGQPSVEVCHITGEADFGNGPVPVGQALSIAQAALDVHISHGDLETFVFLTLPNGREVCSVAGAGGGAPNAGSPGNGQPSVDVCHVTGIADFGTGPVPVGHVITIAQPAYDAHIAHGDPQSFGLLTLPNGREGCSIDSDGDGIPDAVDACPDEGDLGYGIDPDGCPILPPDLNVEGYCVPNFAFPRIVVSNTGGPMPEPATYNVLFEDGTALSGEFMLAAGESLTLDFSNLHGWLGTFTITGYPQLSAIVENCLDPVIQQAMFQELTNSFTDGSLIDLTIPFMNSNGYDIYFEDASFQNLTVSSFSIPGGYYTALHVSGIEINIFADCTTWFCLLIGGDSPGKIYIDSLILDADWMWDAGLTSILVYNESTTIIDLTIEMENAWTDFLISIMEPIIADGLVSDLEQTLDLHFEDILDNSILPLLVE